MRSTPQQNRVQPALYKIGVAAPDELGVTRQMLSGIIDYRGRRLDWELCHIHVDDSFSGLEHFRDVFDAVIAQPRSPDQLRVVSQLQVPVVVLGYELPGLQCVVADENAIGRMAFDSLRGIGLRNFAFGGIRDASFSERRGDAFEAAVKEAGMTCHRYPGLIYPHMDRDSHEAKPLQRWIRNLPVPTGMLIAYSELALEVLHQCHQTGKHVPDELSILAVDDDEILCEFQYPTISAIDQNAYKMGHTAAALLDRMLNGEKLRPQVTSVAPRGVVHRGSTLAVYSAQPWLRKAMEFIQTSVADGLLVSDVMACAGVSRRTLETTFAKELGCGVHDAILRARVQQAKELLETTDLKTFQIARRCGFPYASGFSRCFRKLVGMPPAEYRRVITRPRM